MQLRNKYYTYPVIVEGGNYYTDSHFGSEVEQYNDGYNIELVLKATLKNEQLEKMLKNREVMIAHHIECLQTCFRKVVLTNELEKNYVLRDADVNGKIQVCTFLVANKNIEKYSNNKFSSDIAGFKFDIERGCIMAVGDQYDITVDKIRDDLVNKSSIFSIIPSKEESETNIKINSANNKISIVVPEETFLFYSKIKNDLGMQPIMHSMLIVPALMAVLMEIKEARAHLHDYEEFRWYRSLRKISEKMGITFDEKGLENMEPFDFAQKLIDSPIPKAIYYLRGDDDEQD